MLSQPSKILHTLSALKENIPKPSTFCGVKMLYTWLSLIKMQNYLTNLRPDLIKNPSNFCAFMVHV